MGKKRKWRIVDRVREQVRIRIIGGWADPDGKDEPSSRSKLRNGQTTRRRRDSDKDKDKLNRRPQRSEED